MRTSKYSFIIKIVIFLFSSFLIISCDKPDKKEESKKVSSVPGKADLNIAMFPLNEKDNEYYKILITEYMEKNPDIQIKIEFVDYNNFKENVNDLIAGRTPPDILRVPSGFGLELARSDKLADISSFLTREEVEKYQKGRWVTCLYKNITFGLPESTESYAMWINKTIIDKAKIELPYLPEYGWTWENLILNLKNILESNNEITGIGMNKDLPSLLTWLYTGGGSLFEYDLKTSALLNEKNIEALSVLNKMYADGLIPHDIFSSEDSYLSKKLFENGELVIFIGGSRHFEDFKQNIKDFSFAAAYLPMREGNNPPAFTNGLNLIVSNKTKYPKEAFDLIFWLTSKEITERRTGYSDLLSPRTDTYTQYSDTNGIFEIFFKQAQWMTPQWGEETHINEIEDVGKNLIDKIFSSINGKSDMRNILNDIN